jgi:hypothetical protein
LLGRTVDRWDECRDGWMDGWTVDCSEGWSDGCWEGWIEG